MDQYFSNTQSELLDLSIVIVNYNARVHLRNCLQSIQKTAEDFSYEIIVVDNKSWDGSAEMVREEFPHIRLIANEHNKGFSSANNQGARISHGRYILLLNNDTLALPNSLKTMISIMDKNPRVGLLGCRLSNGDGTLQQSFGRRINFFFDFFRKFITNLYSNKKNQLVGKYLEWRHSKTAEAAWVKGACMFLRRQAFFDADLMDEHYFMFFEEADLSNHLMELGWKVLYTPEAEIVHFGGASTTTNNYRALLEYRKSQLYFYRKHYGNFGEYGIRLYLYLKVVKNYLAYFIRKLLSNRDAKELEKQNQFCRELLKIAQQTS